MPVAFSLSDQTVAELPRFSASPVKKTNHPLAPYGFPDLFGLIAPA
jgi:hypothetical protein